MRLSNFNASSTTAPTPKIAAAIAADTIRHDLMAA
jgi:hypothetical protein